MHTETKPACVELTYQVTPGPHGVSDGIALASDLMRDAIRLIIPYTIGRSWESVVDIFYVLATEQLEALSGSGDRGLRVFEKAGSETDHLLAFLAHRAAKDSKLQRILESAAELREPDADEGLF